MFSVYPAFKIALTHNKVSLRRLTTTENDWGSRAMRDADEISSLCDWGDQPKEAPILTEKKLASPFSGAFLGKLFEGGSEILSKFAKCVGVAEGAFRSLVSLIIANCSVNIMVPLRAETI
jgi:hypothetical protein